MGWKVARHHRITRGYRVTSKVHQLSAKGSFPRLLHTGTETPVFPAFMRPRYGGCPLIDLGLKVSQAEFGNLVGISQQAVSQCVQAGVLSPGNDCGSWLREYCSNLREVAAGRAAGGDLDLAGERALLARAQREGQEIKNDIARGAYAPIELLSDVLANASQSVVDRLDQIPAAIRRVCPDLPHAALNAVMAELASARNEMVRKTISLVSDYLDAGDQPVEDIPGANDD